jgi:hypothetical protein
MVTGTITLNGVTDKELAKIWEFKAKDGKNFAFLPNQMQPVIINNNQPTGTYNNVTFSWKDELGLKVVHEIMTFLLKKDEQATAVNQ